MHPNRIIDRENLERMAKREIALKLAETLEPFIEYTEHKNNLEYKEPHFSRLLGLDENDEQQITRSGDVWTVLDGKDKYGRINEVKVSTGAETYFGSWQGVISAFTETGIFDNINDSVEIDIPDEYKNTDENNQQQYDPNNPNGDPNNNNQQNNNQN